MRDLSIAFAAGAINGLANSIVCWSFGQLGVPAALGVALAPALTPAWLYPRLVWGGLWGLLLLIPWGARSPLWRAATIGLAPMAFQLLIVFPFKGQALFGTSLGTLTLVFVAAYNLVWALAGYVWWSGSQPSLPGHVASQSASGCVPVVVMIHPVM